MTTTPDDLPPANRRITDEDLRSMSTAERHDLVIRLAQLPDGPRAHLDLRKIRRHRIWLVAAGCLGLIPWTVYLGITLPHQYVVRDWTLTWTGFDVILTVMFAATALLGILRRQVLVLAAFTTGVLLLCDAWFDITTSSGTDRWIAVAFAVVAEVPTAALFIGGSMQLLRMTMRAVHVATGNSVFGVPLVVAPRASRGRPQEL